MSKYIIIIAAAFIVTLAVLSKFTFAQTETPTPSYSPTPTAKPSGAPKTGMGWNK